VAKRKRFEDTLSFSRELTYLYHEINERYYRGKLPNLEVYWAPLPAKRKEEFKYGITAVGRKNHRAHYIVINEKLRKLGSDVAELVLIHETIHARHPRKAGDHGKVFEKERRRLILAGAVDHLI
jgi:predicted metal-dependent hydrolase